MCACMRLYVNVWKFVYKFYNGVVCVGCEAVDGGELGVENGFDGEW